ncbi:peptidoglycan recognition protein-like [Macrosteles quadrilineatus]|uniref:peptidoglycan recognition protein-like n=1 Tax=Macrosteles quadrilineatus TaxID=74068 RepID=UPI0023E1FC7F|nr:peptidoglycan recognition protein-like [Macrosteles quadrilineatus]XP_054265014.1 peptidoglycan recognition protein-like [Macrosteles quadrilineatus]
MTLAMVTRTEWGAMPPCHLDPLEPPVRDVAFVHAASLSCHDKEECCQLMRFMQKCHMGIHEMADMKHNFYIAPDGTIYEGRGWLKNTSNYDPYYDEIGLKGKFITIAKIGMDFQDDPATPEQYAAKDAIIKYGIEQKYINPNYNAVKNLVYQYLGDCNPEFLQYKVWQPPPGSENDRTILYKSTTNSSWEEQQKGLPYNAEPVVVPESVKQYNLDTSEDV